MSILPGNESLLYGLSPEEQARYNFMRDQLAKQAAERPELSTALPARYLSQWLAAAVGNRQEISRAVSIARQENIPIPQNIAHVETERSEHQFVANFENSVASASPQDQEAWRLYAQKIKSPSIFSGITNQYYDDDKGQFRAGGIIGAIMGGAIGAFLSKHLLLYTGWKHKIMTFMAVVIGTWLGNKTEGGLNAISNRGMPAEPKLTGSLLERSSNSELGTLPPQPTPPKTPQNQQKQGV